MTDHTPAAPQHEATAHDSSSAGGEMQHGALRVGDKVQLTGPKARMHTLILQRGAEFHTNKGAIRHDDLIGAPDGSVIESTQGVRYLALRPLLRDEVLSMPRGAAIIYPKDAVQILALADVHPGARVVEAGVGSGALSMWLLRSLGDSGRLFSFERREEFAEIADANVSGHFGRHPENWTVTVGDLQQELPAVVADGSADAVILDMLAPWETIDAAAAALRPGGVLVVYVATVTQLSRVSETIRDRGCFTVPQATETMEREWHVEGLAVRPEHRMIGHTGFLTSARRLADGVDLPEISRRPAKDAFDPDDLAVWTPGSVGARNTSEKKLRKSVRTAQRQREQRAAE
ncbi:tRNA (adenine-N1)-methyltransferase [Pseudoclavibacter sp. CFCC 11306]|nr:tRNA (adenine-N1)-methyltransferase [Pseudoclavibacter sp. CFCC 11306]KAB1663514.1 tRNA (adenine-N1)-methyltransferase [Pseudoclavibacter sp. CFCC 13611]